MPSTDSNSVRSDVELLRALVDNVSAMLAYWDSSLRCRFANRAYERWFGVTPESLLGKHISELLGPLYPLNLPHIEGALRGEAQEFEREIPDPHGGPPRQSLTNYIPDIVDGAVRGFFVLATDVSSVKRTELALRESEERFRLTIDEAPIGMALVSLEGRFIRVNRALCEIVGYRADELTGLTFQAITHPEDLQTDLALAEKLARGEIPRYQLEKRYVRKDGSIVHILLSGSVVRGRDGAPLYYIAQIEDITARKRFEDALKESEERFELALKGADLAVWDWNVKTGEVIYSPRWAEMRGFRIEEVRPHVDSWICGVHPADRPTVRKSLLDHLDGRTPEFEAEHRTLTRSGEWIWILDRGKVFARDEQGNPTRMVGTELDVTRRKHIEEALRLSEAKYAGIISLSVDAILSIDEAQRITMFNRGAEQIFGYSRAEILGAPLDVLIPERHRDLHRRHVAEFAKGMMVARQMGDRTTKIVGLRKDGEEFPASASISKVEIGGQTLLTVVLQDITEQTRIEREQRFLAEVGPILASSLDYEETLAKIAELAVREIADLCLVEIVESAQEIRRIKVVSRDPEKAALCEQIMQFQIDRRRPHVMGTVMESRQVLHLQRPSAEMLAEFAQSEEHLRLLLAAEIRSLVAVPLIVHQQLLGAIAFVSSTASRIYGPAEVRLAQELAQRAALSIENARLYRAAQRATQLRDEMLGIVAHDLRNPLNGILLTAQRLRRQEMKGEPPPEPQTPVQVIVNAARRMDQLIQGLLDVTRMEAGRLPIEQAPVSVPQLLSEVAEAEQTLAAAASIELRLEIAPELPEVWADRSRLLQILENLIGNALKFTQAGGRITVCADPQGSEVLFRVRDTGSGIAAEDLPHLFDRFWQGRSERRSGAGLGLSIVRGAVEAHRGRIWVESTPGKGSTFFFTIPTVLRAEQPNPCVAAAR